MLRHLAKAMLPALALFAAGGAQAQLATTVSTNGAPGSYGGSLGLLNDGFYPADGTQYQTGTVHDYSAMTYFDFTFTDGQVNIDNYNLTVDNNDDYTIAFYNGANVVATRQILANQGRVGGGVETFSSDPSRPGFFLANLALLTPVQATKARISSANGDGLYSIGEAEFFAAAVQGVPEPATWVMLIMGFGAIGVTLRRRYLASEAAFTARVRAIAASGDE